MFNVTKSGMDLQEGEKESDICSALTSMPIMQTAYCGGISVPFRSGS